MNSRLPEVWNNDYLLFLATHDHIREVGVLHDEWIKNKNDNTLYNMEKEMMDLHLLLDRWSEKRKDLKEQRIKKFREKANE